MLTRLLCLLVLLAVAGCGSGESPGDPSARSAAGESAVWDVSPDAPPDPSASSFTALVMRVACASGRTGDVLPPSVAEHDDRVVVTFSVAPLPAGDHTCQGNDAVPRTVELDRPLGERVLVDGACLRGEAVSTSFCGEGEQRWPGEG